MNITEFLKARIAEDEEAAAALLADLEAQVSEEYAGMADEKGPMTPARLLGAQLWTYYDGQSRRRSFARGRQIAYLADPARVLAECAAKRAIITAHRSYIDPKEAVCINCRGDEEDEWYREDWPCVTIKALAAVYKDHPDFQQEWAA